MQREDDGKRLNRPQLEGLLRASALSLQEALCFMNCLHMGDPACHETLAGDNPFDNNRMSVWARNLRMRLAESAKSLRRIGLQTDTCKRTINLSHCHLKLEIFLSPDEPAVGAVEISKRTTLANVRELINTAPVAARRGPVGYTAPAAAPT